MNKRKVFGILVLLFALDFLVNAQSDNPNLITGTNRVRFEASSTFPSPASMAPPSNISDEKVTA